MKKGCLETREQIQCFFDDNTPLSMEAALHIQSCKECRSFKDDITRFSTEIDRALDSVIDTDLPDFSVLPETHSSGWRMNRITGFAAALLVVCISLFSYHGFTVYKTRSFLKEETRSFVENLFSKPLYIEVAADYRMNSSTWFDSPDSVSDLFLESTFETAKTAN